MLLEKYLFDVVFIFEWLAFLFSFFNLKARIAPKSTRMFPLILGLILIGESIACLLANHRLSNGIVYNSLFFIWLPGYMAIFYGALTSKIRKRWVLSFLVVFLSVGLVNFLVTDHTVWIAHRTFIMGGLFISVSSVLSLWEISNFPQRLVLKNHPMFWISFSMLVYFFPVSILLCGFEYFKFQDIPMTEAYGNTFRSAHTILNVIHYSMLSYGFICIFIFPQKQETIKVAL